VIDLYVIAALMTASFLWGFRVCERPFESAPNFLQDLGMCLLLALLWPAFWVFTAAVVWVRHQPKAK
jgi:hypothetical protein